MAKKAIERVMPPRINTGGVVRYMTEADGYVMVRRKGCLPFVVPLEWWNSWETPNDRP